MINRSQSYDIYSTRASQSNYLDSRFDINLNSNLNLNNSWLCQSMYDTPESITNEMYKKKIEMMAAEIKPQPVKEKKKEKAKTPNLHEKTKAVSPVLIRIREELAPHFSDVNSPNNLELNIKNYNIKSRNPFHPEESAINDYRPLNNSISQITNSTINDSNYHKFSQSNGEPFSFTKKNSSTNIQIQQCPQNTNVLHIQNNRIKNSQNHQLYQPLVVNQNNYWNFALNNNNIMQCNQNNHKVGNQIFIKYIDYKTLQKMNSLNQVSFARRQYEEKEKNGNPIFSPWNLNQNQFIQSSFPNLFTHNIPNLHNSLNLNSTSLHNFSQSNCKNDNNHNLIQNCQYVSHLNTLNGSNGIQNSRIVQINTHNNNLCANIQKFGSTNNSIQFNQVFITRIIFHHLLTKNG